MLLLMSNRKFKGKYSFDRFIKVTEAADILGYAHFNSINKMIERGDLTAYRLPHVSVSYTHLTLPTIE